MDWQFLTSLHWIQKLDIDADTAVEVKSNLVLHRDRLLSAAQAHNAAVVAETLAGNHGIRTLQKSIQDHLSQSRSERTPLYPDFTTLHLRLRILISQDAEVTTDSTVISSDPESLCALQDHKILMTGRSSIAPSLTHRYSKIYIDTMSTEPSLFTRHKTTLRTVYDEARSRVEISSHGPLMAEVLLWNARGEISEASLSTPYFWRMDRWITPSLECGGNSGVTRRKALEDEVCAEGVVKIDDIKEGEVLWLSNAVRGLFVGRISHRDF